MVNADLMGNRACFYAANLYDHKIGHLKGSLTA